MAVAVASDPPIIGILFVFYGKLSCEECLSNFSHFPLHSLCHSNSVCVLSLYFEIIFPKENSWLSSDVFLLFLKHLKCHSHFLQDPGSFYLNLVFLFSSTNEQKNCSTLKGETINNGKCWFFTRIIPKTDILVVPRR